MEAVAGAVVERVGGPLGQRAVEQDSALAVHVRHVDQRLVEAGVAAVADQGIQVLLVGVLVAATVASGGACAVDRLALVPLGGRVVEVVRTFEVVSMRAVEPHAGPEGEGSSKEKHGDNARRSRTASFVRPGRTTAVESPAAVGWSRGSPATAVIQC